MRTPAHIAWAIAGLLLAAAATTAAAAILVLQRPGSPWIWVFLGCTLGCVICGSVSRWIKRRQSKASSSKETQTNR